MIGKDAAETADDAHALFAALKREFAGSDVAIDVPETNRAGVPSPKTRDSPPCSRRPACTRARCVPTQRVYGVTTLELG
ncbi:hypothetical protein [Streptomyces brasiliensis]|uniref:Uncharacterized protein n=1 Tax=Streptomyces brasiliensis TaxID=1954 RepID=A0A917NUS4_9ACTN|nr:hypothetical protein GCM10010121_046920 [Streptomyces brasiliensis]